MKKLAYPLITAFFLFFAGQVLAATVIEVTKDYTNVPITVDSTKRVYTVTGTVPETTTYYYGYSGYRCLRSANTEIGVNAVVFHAGVSGGSDIYCYPE